MRTIFNHLKFNSEVETTKYINKTKWEMFIPGINSGVYKPASLCIHAVTEETKAGLFSLKKTMQHANLTLSWSEFDALYEEMTKIKNLRDNENISGK
jgi:hypothetical protein